MSGGQEGGGLGEAAEQSGKSGRWIEPGVSYIHPERRFCGYCGRPIARRYWQQDEGGRQAYCGPGHAARTTYPKRAEYDGP